MHHNQDTNPLMLTFKTILAAAIFVMATSASAAEQLGNEGQYEVRLRSRTFTPSRGVEPQFAERLTESLQRGEKRHAYVQFVRLPDRLVREQLKAIGLELLQFVGSTTWHAVLRQPAVLEEDARLVKDGQFGIRWIGPISPVDKESPYLRSIGVRNRDCRMGGDS